MALAASRPTRTITCVGTPAYPGCGKTESGRSPNGPIPVYCLGCSDRLYARRGKVAQSRRVKR